LRAHPRAWFFLGVEIDSWAGEVRLPQSKLAQLVSELDAWTTKRRCIRRELESITGKLQHAARVVKSGRSFVRRLFDLIAKVKKPDHHVKLNAAARSDLAWWSCFMCSWNGVSLLRLIGSPPANVVLTSDASGWGCGAYFDNRWFQLPWSATWVKAESIAVKELIPIVLAGAVWGDLWSGNVVLCRCDNESVVAVVNSRTSRDPGLMHLLRCLAFVEAHWGFYSRAVHLPGVENSLADDLSRDRLERFLASSHSVLSQVPTTIPSNLLEVVCNSRPDWTSPAWSQCFSSCVKKV